MSLNSFLTGIANAIRNKKGTTEPINAQDFASEIESLGIKLNPVTNIQLSSSGMLSWKAPDTTEIEDKLVSISYVINLNGKEITSDTNSISVISYVVVGENTVSIKAIIGLYNEETQSIIEYELPSEPAVIILETTLSQAKRGVGAVAVGTNVYIFGGYNGNRFNTIEKFDTTTETITTLSTTMSTGRDNCKAALVGTNIYLFNAAFSNTIEKFDTTTETITTLSTTLSANENSALPIAVGTNIYIFKGTKLSSNLKFDTTTETITTLSTTVTLDYNSNLVSIGTNIYHFKTRDLYIFDTINETLSSVNLGYHETLGNSPGAFIQVAKGTNIYLFGGNSSNVALNTVCRIDTLTNTLSILDITLPNTLQKASISCVDETIYIFGGEYTTNNFTNEIIKVINLT